MAARALQRPSRPFTEEIHLLAADHDPACLVDLAGTVLFVNDAWERFAAENGDAGACSAARLVGTRVVDHLAGDEARGAFAALLERAAQRPLRGGRPRVVQTAECNGPDVARLVATQAVPVLSPTGAPVAVALVHRVVRRLPIEEVHAPVDGASRSWRGPGGELVQCGSCRRTRRPEDAEEWDFVPGLVAAPPPDTRFTYCALCRELHGLGGG